MVERFLDFVLTSYYILRYKMDAFLKKVDQVAVVDTSKLNMFLLKEKALEFTKILSENPNFTQGKICKMLGTSDSTMRRIRNDLGMSSPFRHAVKIKKSRKGQTSEGLKHKGENTMEVKSFYCTDCSKVFKSSKSSPNALQNHVCKPKDTLASGGLSRAFSIFNKEEVTSKEEVTGEEDTAEETSKKQLNDILKGSLKGKI